MVSHQPDVVCLVLVRHCHVSTSRNQIHHLVFAKVGRFRGERQLESEHVERHVEDLLERFVVVWLDGFDVGVLDGVAQHVLVEGAGEVRVHQLIVADGLADNPNVR